MPAREKMKAWVVEALKAHGGKAKIPQVAKHIWDNHENDIKQLGTILYTWQYDVRWAAQVLRDKGILKPVHGRKDLPWELA